MKRKWLGPGGHVNRLGNVVEGGEVEVPTDLVLDLERQGLIEVPAGNLNEKPAAAEDPPTRSRRAATAAAPNEGGER